MSSNRVRIVVDAFHPITDVFSATLCDPIPMLHLSDAALDLCNLHNAPEALHTLIKWLPYTAKRTLAQICKGANLVQAVNCKAKLSTNESSKHQLSVDASEDSIYYAVMFFLATALAPVIAAVPESASASMKLEAVCMHLLTLMREVSKERERSMGPDRTTLGEVGANDSCTLLTAFPTNFEKALFFNQFSLSFASYQLLLRCLFLSLSRCWRRTPLLVRQAQVTGADLQLSSRARRPSHFDIHRVKKEKACGGYGEDDESKTRNENPWESVDSLLLFYPAEYYSRQLDAALTQRSFIMIPSAQENADTNSPRANLDRYASGRRKYRRVAKKDRATGELMRVAYPRARNSRIRSIPSGKLRRSSRGYRIGRLSSEESSTTTKSGSTGDESMSSFCANETET